MSNDNQQYAKRIESGECKEVCELSNSEFGISNLYYFEKERVYAIAAWHYGALNVECIFSDGRVLHEEE
jgi:hypothetical protein